MLDILVNRLNIPSPIRTLRKLGHSRAASLSLVIYFKSYFLRQGDVWTLKYSFLLLFPVSFYLLFLIRVDCTLHLFLV